jgi:murein DD-endopeptidase MepM/ murein hydrolase activator NlpD
VKAMTVKDILIAFSLTLLSLAVTVFYSQNRPLNVASANENPAGFIPVPVIQYKYGLPVDSFLVVSGKVKPNQPLSSLFANFGLNTSVVNQMVQKTEGVFDVRKFRSGNTYFSFQSIDSAASLEYLVYEHTPIDYVVFRFRDSLDVYAATKQIDTIRSTYAGSIETSLWNAMISRQANPMLAIELSEIYAWSIDFFGLQKGDSIRVVYDELFVDSLSIGIGLIHAAWFRHMNHDFLAVPFVQDGREDYFDAEGLNLRKAFLKAPLRFSRISSGFSNSRLHPILKIRRPHHGVDYAAPAGTPVVAIGDGIITKLGYEGAAGHMVRIRHNSVYSTAYLHLGKYGNGIKTGGFVKQGDIIGYVGSTGLSTGPHLDFRFYKNGAAVDPLKVEAPPVDPVKEENMQAFEIAREQALSVLEIFQ